MSKLKISPNLFLEVAELNRLVQFIKTDGYEQIIKAMVKKYGIIKNLGNTYFKPTVKTGTTNQLSIAPGKAIDPLLQVITLRSSVDLTLNDNGTTKWIVLGYSTTNYEFGTVSITADGGLQGNGGTKFTEVLRGQPNFPTKVKFNSTINTEEYEVVSVTNDSMAVLSGNFQPQSNLQYAVIGTFTPGFQPSEWDKTIYDMDDCFIASIESDIAPALTSGQYLIASCYFTQGELIVNDLRFNNMFNYEDFENGVTYDPLVSLVRVQKIEYNLLELTVEHSYQVYSFKITINIDRSVTISILGGNCNFLGGGDIPDGLFAGWEFMNKKTMKKLTVSNNINKDLIISDYDPSVVVDVEEGFLLVPPYNNLEYKITYSGTTSDVLPYFQLVTQGSGINKFLIVAPQGKITIGLRYRLITGGNSTAWNKFATAAFIDENGESRMIGDSQFETSINVPVVELRNYS